MKKQSVLFFLCWSVGFIQMANAISLERLATITKDLMNKNGLNYAVNLSVDDRRASGYAAISYDNVTNHVFIYVDSRQLAYKSSNTWAFVMGHELGHKFLGAISGPAAEWAADEKGGEWAVNAGYNVAGYIQSILNEYNACSKSHGCWHGRAHNLARIHGVDIYGSNEKDHETHRPGHGAYPPAKGSNPNPHDHDHGHDTNARRNPCHKPVYRPRCAYRNAYTYLRRDRYSTRYY